MEEKVIGYWTRVYIKSCRVALQLLMSGPWWRKSGTCDDTYSRPVNPISVSLLPHFLCCRRIFSKPYYLRSLFTKVVLIGASIPGPSQLTLYSLHLLSQLLEETGASCYLVLRRSCPCVSLTGFSLLIQILLNLTYRPRGSLSIRPLLAPDLPTGLLSFGSYNCV